MKKAAKTEIASILQGCIDGTINRIAKAKTYKPFHDALLTKEIVSASAFERSFSTSFGQGPIEKISRIIALSTGAEFNGHPCKSTQILVDPVSNVMPSRDPPRNLTEVVLPSPPSKLIPLPS